jgi:hypothetical protein
LVNFIQAVRHAQNGREDELGFHPANPEQPWSVARVVPIAVARNDEAQTRMFGSPARQSGATAESHQALSVS